MYHHGRAVGVDAITGATATRIAETLADNDAWVIALLVERARRDFGAENVEPGTRVRDFARGDWDVVQHLVRLPAKKSKRNVCRRLLKRLRRKVAAAIADPERDKLARLYHRLAVLDRPISAVLALELRLIDAVSPDWEEARIGEGEDRPGSLRIPEWQAIFPPTGAVDRQTLCRHGLILGETASGILPVVAAMLRESSPVGCALVIDPKSEVGPVVRNLARAGTDVVEIDLRRADGRRPVVDLMAESRSVAGHVASGRVLTAAREILIRTSSLTASNPAKLLAGKTSTAREPYWEMEGSRLAQTILGLVLILYTKARKIFGTSTHRGVLAGAPEKVCAALGSLGARAGIAVPHPDIEAVAERARERFGSDAPEVRRTDFARDVRETGFYRACAWFQDEFEALKAKCPEPRAADPYELETWRLIDAACQAAVCARQDWAAELGPNVLAVAHVALQEAFSLDRSIATPSSDWPGQSDGWKPNFVAAAASVYLRSLEAGDEIDETLDLIESYWNPMASAHTGGQYTGAFGLGRTCLVDFADPVPARTLYFGCEPEFRDHGLGRMNIDFIRFRPDVEAPSGCKVYVFRPDLGAGREALVARALKATFFEAILDSRGRQEDGALSEQDDWKPGA